MQGYPPAVSVEFAHKALLEKTMLTFHELEQAVVAVAFFLRCSLTKLRAVKQLLPVRE